ncbi:MAG: hypothetical protein ACRDDY_08120 [Clostridium sp.]|uniref:hypothetical protein n=1 Tax=Clostridium sp. TaxID=1506 RepID=UPI003EE75866
MEKVLIGIDSIEKNNIKFYLDKVLDINKEDLKVIDILDNREIEKDRYNLEAMGERYFLKLRDDIGYYFYIKNNNIMSNYIYIYRKSVILNEKYMYIEFLMPNEEHEEIYVKDGFLLGKKIVSNGGKLNKDRGIDIEKSYFVLEDRGQGKFKMNIYLYGRNGEKLDGNYKINISKKGGEGENYI